MSHKFNGIQIKPRGNENPEVFIKRFTRAVRSSGILDEWRERQVYDKPSVQRRRKHARAMWRAAHSKE